MSESYLSAVFKKEMQKNFIQYVTDCKMNKAAEFLRDTDLPSYTIADKLGYSNINYFGRVFKKVMGMNPTEYRALFR